MIAEAIRETIVTHLARAEREHDVRMLLAIESGSRAWGFASTNSDYDVRFIYCRRQDWYLAIDTEDKRDVIEYPIVDDIDCNGWDLRKARRLLWNSSPAIVEWLQSPMTYIERGDFCAATLALLPRVYSQIKGIYHYRSTAKTNYRGYLQAERVRLKKYFYVPRPLLAVRWLEAHGTPAPMELEKLLITVAGDSRLVNDFHALLANKKAGLETDLAPPVPSLKAFTETELARLAAKPSMATPRQASNETLNTLFRELVSQTWMEPPA